ncbi:MAG: enoyl-CoA hydratase/carnithine racemase [Phenylobacterium sp.]|nr:enoyl-CoA hydratase/carnithine racemase [Phenylobacterium sp.]
MAQEILIERRADAMLLRLNRPERRNALNRALTAALRDALDVAEADPDVRSVVLISSTPGMFCAGGDLIAMGQGEIPNAELVFDALGRADRAKPVIAAVDGPVLGGGLELALACDLVVATQAAVFGLPEASLGILAAGGGVFRLPRRIPRAVALEVILAQGRLGAERAYALGLVNAVTPPADLLAAALELAGRIAACTAPAIAASLLLARSAHEMPEEELWRLARSKLATLRASDEHKAALAAFASRRAPKTPQG